MRRFAEYELEAKLAMGDSRKLVLVAALTLVWAGTVRAQATEEEELALAYGDKSTISIATGSQQPIRRAPAVATVVTAEDIAAIGATDLDEVLETVPGLHVNRSANLYSPLYVIRGVVSQYTPQTLVLQNGVPMTTLFIGNKGNIWGGYPVEHIARIEVIRGPGSALYGADAFSGVINIITKTAADTPGPQFGVRGGSFDTWDGWVQHGGKLGVVDVAAYLRVGSTNGFRETVTRDAASFSAASLAPGPVHTGRDAIDGNLDLAYDKWRLRFGYKLRDNVETGAGIAQALDPVGRAKSQRVTADLSWTDSQFARDLTVGLLGSFLHYTQLSPTDFVLFPPGINFGTGIFTNGMIGGPDTWERQFRLSAFATYTGFADHSLRFGLGHDDLNLYKTRETKNFTFTPSGVPVPVGPVSDFSATAPFLFPQQRKVNYAYIQDEWNFAKDWTLTAGLRYDDYSDFGRTTNPRLALVWEAAYNLTAKLLYGRAFRAPAFVEQYSINNPVAQGNPNLRPETIHTEEAALSWQARKDTQVNLGIFRHSMKDTIRTVPNAIPNTGSMFSNTGNQEGRGVELEAVWDISRSLRLLGNYAFQHATDVTSGRDAGYAPRNQLYARADWQFSGGWLCSTQFNWVADRKRAPTDTRPDVPDYKTVDLTLRSTATKNQWGLAASVRNLFNADVREPSLAPGSIRDDLPMPRRTFYLQASYGL